MAKRAPSHPAARVPAPLPAGAFLAARPVLTREWHTLDLVLVGCGGTGSWLAPHLAHIVREVERRGKTARLLLIDPDSVEAGNIGRQHFCPAELGRPKAATLAARLSAAYGLTVGYIAAPFAAELLPPLDYQDHLRVLVGAVDNAPARAAIARALPRHGDAPPTAWWCDSGNEETSGQVLLGSTADPEALRGAFLPAGVCRALPSPALQAPDLLVPRPAPTPAGPAASCAALAARQAQSLGINAAVAAVAADMLIRLLLSGGLSRFATWLDLETGSARSYYTAPDEVGRVIGKPPAWFAPKTR